MDGLYTGAKVREQIGIRGGGGGGGGGGGVGRRHGSVLKDEKGRRRRRERVNYLIHRAALM